jgi:hypothetical protein
LIVPYAQITYGKETRSAPGRAKHIDDNGVAERVDRALGALRLKNAVAYDVIFCRFVRGWSCELTARYLGIPAHYPSRITNDSVQWLDGHLTPVTPTL